MSPLVLSFISINVTVCTTTITIAINALQTLSKLHEITRLSAVNICLVLNGGAGDDADTEEKEEVRLIRREGGWRSCQKDVISHHEWTTCWWMNNENKEEADRRSLEMLKIAWKSIISCISRYWHIIRRRVQRSDHSLWRRLHDLWFVTSSSVKFRAWQRIGTRYGTAERLLSSLRITNKMYILCQLAALLMTLNDL